MRGRDELLGTGIFLPAVYCVVTWYTGGLFTGLFYSLYNSKLLEFRILLHHLQQPLHLFGPVAGEYGGACDTDICTGF